MRSAADGETHEVAARWLVADIDLTDVGGGRTLPERRDQSLELLGAPFGNDLDAAVGTVGDPAIIGSSVEFGRMNRRLG